jgi:hypothetical protein
MSLLLRLFGSNMDHQGRAFLIQQIIWIAIGFAISLAISFLVPFPYSLGIMLGVFLGISYGIRAWAMRKIRRSAGYFNESIYNYILGFNHGRALTFYCMNCGFKHDKRECPKCGSKARKVG